MKARTTRDTRPRAARKGPQQISLPEWGLFVREPFATRIVAAGKTWELRKRTTARRGRIGIVCDKRLIGTAELYDVLGPFRPEDLAGHVDKHRAPMTHIADYANGTMLWAWALRKPLQLAAPVEILARRGAVVWIRLRPNRP